MRSWAIRNHDSFPDSAKVANRDINSLDQDVQGTVAQLIADAKADGITLTIAETARGQDRQAYLYGQGRGNNPGNVVTWTLDSDHAGRRALDLWSASEDKGGPGQAGWDWIQRNAPSYGFKVLGDQDQGHISLASRLPRKT